MAHYFPYDVKLRLLADSRSFIANQKARNAIVGAENLLIADSRSFLANQKARNAIVGAENLLKYNSDESEIEETLDSSSALASLHRSAHFFGLFLVSGRVSSR